jgi:hypothetical protein
MKTSRLFSLTSRSLQTVSMSRSLVTTRPAERNGHSRIANSVRVKVMARFPRQALCSPKSSIKSANRT